jgi:hypothetical protein
LTLKWKLNGKRIATELKNVDRDLCFEFGPLKREFVISAGGIKRAFPAVISLANAAPPLERWQVIAFRSRRTPINSVLLGGKPIDPNDVQFSLFGNGKMADINLFIPGFRENEIAFK